MNTRSAVPLRSSVFSLVGDRRRHNDQTLIAGSVRWHKISSAAELTTLIATDENNQYEGIGDHNTRHETVSHTQKEWVRGIVHTNGLEGVWSLFKRSIVGSYHQISVKHLDRYLDEFEFRFNNRENSFLFRDTLLRLLASTNLEYKNLIAEDDEAA